VDLSQLGDAAARIDGAGFWMIYFKIMLPMALGLGDGGEMQAPMGRAIIGGVTTSTLLTLVVVPVIYTYLDNISIRFKRRRERIRAEQDALAQAAGVMTERLSIHTPFGRSEACDHNNHWPAVRRIHLGLGRTLAH